MCTTAEALAKRKQCRSSTRRVNAHGHSLNGKAALQSPHATTLPRPPHPIPTSVTIAIRPSLGTGWRGIKDVIWVKREVGIFSREGWTRIC